MIEVGRKQTLAVIKKVDFGVYLGESADSPREEQVLLPKSQIPENIRVGENLNVFIYRDSSDRLIATVKEPLLEVGKTALLTVKQVTKIGAFLDWGLEKDLLLPYREQTVQVKEEDQVLCALYVDKSGRLCATMKLYHYLSTRPPYSVGDEVKGRVYEISRNFGVFVAVDDKYSALIPAAEVKHAYTPGEVLSLRVTDVKEDGKMNVSDRQKAYLQLGADGEAILRELEKQGGSIPFDDKSDPEKIKEVFGISKAAFKRALGHLYKDGRVELMEGCTILKKRN